MQPTNLNSVQLDELEIVRTRSGAGSYQPLAVDLTVAAAVGSDDIADSDYLAPIMGNILADDPLTGEGNYLAGVIGKYNIPGEVGSKYPTGGVIGEIGEEIAGNLTAKPDGCVVAVIGGDGQAVKPRAYFAARHLNSNSGSGPEFGIDLYDPHADDLNYGQGEPSVAAIRFPNGQLLVTLDTAITANTTVTTAPAGSLGITSHATGVGKLFVSDGAGKWQFAAIS